MKTHRILKKIKQMCKCYRASVIVKTSCFYSFTINSQSKLENSAHYSREIYQEKLATKFNKVSWRFELEILEIWTWIFFKYSKEFSLKVKKKLFSKKDTRHLKIASQNKSHNTKRRLNCFHISTICTESWKQLEKLYLHRC